MKFMKLCAFSAIALMASFAFADAANLCILFSTEGPDQYADGTTVVDGEWYALVWKAPGAEFGGLTSKLGAVSANNEVVLAAPLAEGGKCPLVLWQVDSANKKTDGSYTVVMLDTRGSDGKPAGKGADGKPLVVYAANTTDATVASGNAFASATEKSVSTSAVASSGTEGMEQPVIESIEIVGEQVKITVTGMVPGLTYTVKSGTEPDSLTEMVATVPQKDDEATETVKGRVFVPAADAAFFSIKGE